MFRVQLLAAALVGLAAAAHAAAAGPDVYVQLGHSDRVNSVAFSPDGRILASGSFDDTIKLWDTASGRELRTLSESPVYVSQQLYERAGNYSVAFSPDGRTLAAGSGDHSIKIWDAPAWGTVEECPLELHPHAADLCGKTRGQHS